MPTAILLRFIADPGPGMSEMSTSGRATLMTFAAVLAIAASLYLGLGNSAEGHAAACTSLAAHPDEKLPNAGLFLWQIKPAEAQKACAAALERLDRPELHFRYARALVAGNPSDADKALALSHARQAVDGRYVLANVTLATLYTNGWGTSPDLSKAAGLLAAPVAQDLPSALMLAATVELNRPAPPGGQGRAIALLDRALSVSPPAYFTLLGSAYLSAGDPRRAITAYEKAEAQGQPAGSYGIAQIYADPATRTGTPALAHAKFMRAAHASMPEAENRVAWNFYNGAGVAQDHREALLWARKAADHGWTAAQYLAGFMIFNAQGTQKDGLLAERYLAQAAAGGNSDASKLLAATVAPFASALRAMPSGTASGCVSRQTSRYDSNVIEYLNSCAHDLTALVCTRFLVGEVMRLFDAKDREGCRLKRVGPKALIDDLYGADMDSSLLRILISQTQIRIWSCFHPLTPKLVGEQAQCIQ